MLFALYSLGVKTRARQKHDEKSAAGEWADILLKGANFNSGFQIKPLGKFCMGVCRNFPVA